MRKITAEVLGTRTEEQFLRLLETSSKERIEYAVETPDPHVELALQGGPLPSLGKDENSESQFAENDGVDGDVRLMCAKPLDDTGIGHWFRRLTENAGVNRVLHSVSVDSEPMGATKSSCGQASSQSATPSFGGAARRTRR